MATVLHRETFDGIEYTYHNGSNVKFHDAESNCKYQGSELAYIKDEATWNKTLEYVLGSRFIWWIGLKRNISDNASSPFVWLDDDKYGLMKNITDLQTKHTNCGTMKVFNKNTAIIKAVQCEKKIQNYICQRNISRISSTDTGETTEAILTNTHTNFGSPSNNSTFATTVGSNSLHTGTIIAFPVFAILLLLAIAFLVRRYKVKQKKNTKPLLEVSYTSCHATSNGVGDYSVINTVQNFEPCPQALHSASARDQSLYNTANEFRGDYQEVAQSVDNIQLPNSDTAGTSEQVTYAQVNKPRNTGEQVTYAQVNKPHKTTNVQQTIAGDVYAQVNKSK